MKTILTNRENLRFVVGVLAGFVSSVLACEVQAIDATEWIGVIGVSPDGTRYALCRAYGDIGLDVNDMRNDCTIFKRSLNKLKEDDLLIDEMTIYLCRTVEDPLDIDIQHRNRICEKSWKPDDKIAELKKIKKLLRSEGIQVADSVRYLAVDGKNRFTIPKDVLKQYDIYVPIAASWSRVYRSSNDDNSDASPGEWKMEFRAQGYGSIFLNQGNADDHGDWEYYLESVTIAHGTHWMFYNIGTAMEEASYIYPWAIRLDKVVARLINVRGFRRHKKGDFKGSAEDFARAFEMDPEFGLAAFNAACAEAKLGRKKESLEFLKKAIDLQPEESRKKARKDGDFDSLRSDSAFKKLVGEAPRKK